jgi:hypothetical protein
VIVGGKVVFDGVGGGIVDCEGNVVVVRSPPGGEIVVITVELGLLGLVVGALSVQPATNSVMATAATAPSLRTIGIMTPTTSSAVSRTTHPRDDDIQVPTAAEVGMRTLADGRTD